MRHFFELLDTAPFFYAWVSGIVGFVIGGQLERWVMRAERGPK